MPGKRNHWQAEHQMGDYRDQQSTAELSRAIYRHIDPTNAVLHSVGDSHSWIEVRPGDTAERQNESDKNRSGCYRVCQKGKGNVTAS